MFVFFFWHILRSNCQQKKSWRGNHLIAYHPVNMATFTTYCCSCSCTDNSQFFCHFETLKFGKTAQFYHTLSLKENTVILSDVKWSPLNLILPQHFGLTDVKLMFICKAIHSLVINIFKIQTCGRLTRTIKRTMSKNSG